MHIPDQMLQGAVCPVTAGVGLLGVVMAAVIAAKTKEQPGVSRFAAVAALIFAAQMLNFPVSDGTSGHLLGGVLAAALLGTPLAVLAMALVVTVQACLFGDGGLLCLGANVVNMALLGVGVGGLLHSVLDRKPTLFAPVRIVLTFAACWMSVMLAALAVSAELAYAGAVPLSRVIPAMLGVHAWIGIGEGILTVALVEVLSARGSERVRLGSAAVPLALTGIMVLLSPWATSLPDGLEWVAARYGFLPQSAISFSAPLADYRLAIIEDPRLAVVMAACLGVVLILMMTWLIGGRLHKSPVVTEG